MSRPKTAPRSSIAVLCVRCSSEYFPRLSQSRVLNHVCAGCRNEERRAKRHQAGGRVILRWNSEEDAALLAGTETLPGRSARAVRLRRHQLTTAGKSPLAGQGKGAGLKAWHQKNRQEGVRPSRKGCKLSERWFSSEEDTVLRTANGDRAKMQELLPHRCKGSLRVRCKALGISLRPGTLWVGEKSNPWLTRLRSAAHACPQKPMLLFYPFVAPGARSHALIDTVNAAVPRRLPEHIRSEVCQEIILAVLEGDLAADAISQHVSTYIKRVYRLFPYAGAHLSLDMPLFDDGPTTLGDRIESTVFRF